MEGQNTPLQVQIDAFPPPQIAERAEDIGVVKANLDFWTLLLLSILAGAFIALGAVFSTTVTSLSLRSFSSAGAPRGSPSRPSNSAA